MTLTALCNALGYLSAVLCLVAIWEHVLRKREDRELEE